MKKLFLLPASLLLLNMPASAQKTSELPASHTKARPLSEYHAIDAFNGVEVKVSRTSPTNKAGVYVEASSSGLLRKIKTVVSEQILKVYLDPDGDPAWRGVKRPENYNVRIVLDDLQTLRITKGAVVTFESGFSLANNRTLAIDLLSGGKVLGPVHLNALTITLRGGAEAFMRGTVSRVNVRAVEGSSFLSPGLESQDCIAYAASASYIRLGVAQTLDAQSMNEADIKYSGNPAVKNASCKDGGKILRTLKI